MTAKFFSRMLPGLLLIAVFTMMLAACTDAAKNGETDGLVQNTEGKQVEEDKNPGQGSNEVTEEPDPGLNKDKEEPEDETQDNAVSPEELLEGYYYGVVDAPIVDFELEDLEGNKVRLSDFKGRIVFLNFWATWCPPCREEMPHMQAFYEKYKNEDVVILAVNSNMTENQGINNSSRAEERARKFVEQEGYTFPVLLDRDDSVWAVYRQRGIPANYMIDRDGTVKYLKPGAFLSLQEMEDFAAALGAGSK